MATLMFCRPSNAGAPGSFDVVSYVPQQLKASCSSVFHASPFPTKAVALSRKGFPLQAGFKVHAKRVQQSPPPFPKSNVLYLEADHSGANSQRLEPVIDLLKNGAVGVIPTDTVYAFVCDVKNTAAVERLHRIRELDDKKPLGILCHSFRDIDIYTTGFPKSNKPGQVDTFRAVRRCLPGPYTFILPATKELPKHCVKYGKRGPKYASQKLVAVRMPNDGICQSVLSKLDAPLVCASVKTSENDWILDPRVIADTYGSTPGREGVDFVVDGGVHVANPSTVVDLTGTEPALIRKGKGPVFDWMLPKNLDETLI